MKQKNSNLNIDPYLFLEATLHREGKNIFNLAYRLCQDKEEAKKIARSAFLKTLKNFRRFESSFPIYIFLCRATFRIWKSGAGRRTEYPARLLHSSGPCDSGTVTADPIISRNKIKEKEQLALLRKGLAGLRQTDNFIIVLRDIEGKSCLEIACILKCRYHAVNLRLAQARKRIHASIVPDRKNIAIISPDCRLNRELFSAQLDSLLLPSVEENLQKHLRDCPECQETFQYMATTQKLLSGSDSTELPDNFEAGILKTAKEILARKPAPGCRPRYLSCALGSAVLVLVILTAFFHHKVTPKTNPATPPSSASSNALFSTKKSVITEKISRAAAETSFSDPPPHTVIRNKKEWANIWRLQNASRNISALLPEVDFSAQMVVLIISQDDKSEYTITEAEENKNGMIIRCERTSLTHQNPPMPLYQFRIIDAKPTVIFEMVRER
ncbi:MAG: hypothetical protein NTY10_01075 [Candidatus Omnitrophica bacterium]|nr:hypothetical protein [Candidatus Omnitrophota bacterium]